MVSVTKVQLTEMLPLLSSGSYVCSPQNHSESNVWRKRGEKDGEIDWRMSASTICNLVRGLAKPYIGAHMLINDKVYKIWKARKHPCVNVDNIEPGKVMGISSEGHAIIKCGEGCVELLEVVPESNLGIGVYL